MPRRLCVPLSFVKTVFWIYLISFYIASVLYFMIASRIKESEFEKVLFQSKVLGGFFHSIISCLGLAQFQFVPCCIPEKLSECQFSLRIHSCLFFLKAAISRLHGERRMR